MSERPVSERLVSEGPVPDGVTSERVTIEGVEFAAALTLRSDVGVLALHGSREGGTAELAREVAARAGATALVFTQPAGDPVHIPSHRMASAPCASLDRFLSHVCLVVSLHGHFRPAAPRSVFLGGGNRGAARTLGHSLTLLAPDFDAVTDLDRIPTGLRGLHPRNPVNLARDKGVQLELPLSARTHRPERGPGTPDRPRPEVADALVAGIERLAAGPGR
ncbi:poly-gamma-glutamate hydrolase family protein [Streptomyces sp. TG1A-8]|uniref:poly-gamma-glutamate hydrolase family protein n=1 Tax=Streptomyces sp. TG1A-8 TaxID=3051385 RepID=UPI00265C491E|nr:poly-gamma-glutamate hydrolase family protein [Streptomyces sp. TG1A-8]MDO0926990.1 poly-gamma-glutamate hydrolase family protein [Streptomyces sp. TG1A-8]